MIQIDPTAGAVDPRVMAPQQKMALRVTVADIQASVCTYYGLNREELIGPARNRAICWPRQMAMAITRKTTFLSLPDIGRSFGGRDHTTVKHACEAVENRCDYYPEQQVDLDAIMADLKPIPRAEFFRSQTLRGTFVSVRKGGLQ